jgi:hypothetical protein
VLYQLRSFKIQESRVETMASHPVTDLLLKAGRAQAAVLGLLFAALAERNGDRVAPVIITPGRPGAQALGQ